MPSPVAIRSRASVKRMSCPASKHRGHGADAAGGENEARRQHRIVHEPFEIGRQQ